MNEQFNQFGTGADLGTGVATATQLPARNIPARTSMLTEEVTTLRPENTINRDTARYVVLAGDFMIPEFKQQFRDFEGSQIGGQWFSLSEIPCLWKTQGFITRGFVTPIVKRPEQSGSGETMAHSKAKEAVAQTPEQMVMARNMGDKPNPYRLAYPYDSLNSIVSEKQPARGVVEVAALEGVDWDLRVVQDIQKFFFPNWEAIVAGQESLPFLLRLFTEHIEKRMNVTGESAIRNVGEAFLRSATIFRAYAEAKVTQTKRLAERTVNDRGFTSGISAEARHLAAQIEMDIEAPTLAQTIGAMVGNQPQQQAQSVSQTSPEEIELRRRELDLREREIALKEREAAIELKPQTAPDEVVTNEIVVEETTKTTTTKPKGK